MAKQKKTEQSPEEVYVKLKPVLGIQPAVYLTILYAAIALLVLFLVLFLPGIRNHGSRVTFESVPTGSAVYIDGGYVGSTPCTVFVESGTRSIRIDRYGFESATEELDVGGRLFGSLFFKQKADYHAVLALTEPEKLLRRTARELNEWAMIDAFSTSYQAEPVASRAVDAIVQAMSYSDPAGSADDGFGGDGTEGGTAAGDFSADEIARMLDRFLMTSLLSAADPVIADDVIRAVTARFSRNGIVTPDGVLDSVGFFIQAVTKYKNLMFLLPELLEDIDIGETPGERIVDKEWYRNLIDSFGSTIAMIPGNQGEFGRVEEISGISFVQISDGRYVQGLTTNGDEHPFPRSMEGFFIGATEITQGQFAEFIEANPVWGKHNKGQLVLSSVADESYLDQWDPTEQPNKPVRFVSYNAAVAYCRWLTEQLPGAYEGWTVRLPTESEWEWAARTAAVDPAVVFSQNEKEPHVARVSVFAASEGPVYDLLGNLWEWCEEWYYPLAYYATSWDGDALVDETGEYEGVERVVRGGSWANSPLDQIDSATRGSQRPSWSTAFVGFRPVLVR